MTLTGSGADADGTIATYQWAQISGPSTFNIASPSQAQTAVNNLVQGTYQFQLTVTDNQGATGTDTVVITVNPAANIPPVANAGTDQSITLPVNTVTLTGSGADADGTIATYQWAQISGPSTFNIASPSQAQTAVNNLVQGTYQFQLTVTDNQGATGTDTVVITVNPAVNIPPLANAGADQSITLPVNTVTLTGSGTDADGTIASYQWAQISGPSTFNIASPSQAQTAVNNLVPGVYQFQLTVTDNLGATATDTVNIIVNTTPGNCNPAAPAVYTLLPTSGTDIYLPDASSLGWKGGDTLRIPAGNYGLIDLGHFKGDSCRPIVIINYGRVVNVGQMRFISDAAYFKLTGAGDPNYQYGIKVHSAANAGVAITTAHDVEVCNLDVSGTEVGFYFKVNPDPADPFSIYPNYVLSNYNIHHNYIHDTHGEGMYIGHTYPNGDPYSGNLIPIRMDKIEIAYNIVDSTDWDGIQLSNARTGAKIHDNSVSNFGRINLGDQQAGIILGGNTNGDIYNNTVKNGTGNGIEAFGYGIINIYNNDVENAGADGTTMGQESVFCNDPINTIETNPVQQIYHYNNTVKNPKPKGAIRVGAYNYNSGPAQVTDNQYCIPNAPSNWQSIYIAINPAGSVLSNNVLMTSCSSQANISPVANAGTDQTITLPINTVTLTGSGTDADGTIVSYQWTKVSGPASYNIVSPLQAQTVVNNLIPGIYQFEFQVTDNLGASAKDTMTLIVNVGNIPPVANAGTDQTITLPINTVTLTGNGTDADGTIASYQWAQIAGPATYSIVSPSQAQTAVNNLVQGVYQGSS